MTLVVGVCKTLGTDCENALASLGLTLRKHGYEVERLHLASFLTEGQAIEQPKTKAVEDWRPLQLQLMERGNALCQTGSHGVALVKLAIQKIAERQGGRRAFIVTSLKRPEEVRALREIYGKAFLLVSIDSSAEQRAAHLTKSLRQQYPLAADYEIDYWLKRLAVLDHNDGYDCGQRGTDVHSEADLFITASSYSDPEEALSRSVRALLGAPFSTPSRDEYFMQLACSAGLRSSERGRQVGAAVVDKGHELLAVGCNEVPRPGGGQYWPDDDPDARDFVQRQDANARLKSEIVREIEERLQNTGTSNLRDILEGSQLAEIIEFGRITHGEMSAICSAAATGRSLRGARLYVTTYPCHMCMRLIIACGIEEVVYLHPYTKSRTNEMYATEVSHSNYEAGSRVLLRRFQGITGVRFAESFSGAARREVVKLSDGTLEVPWNSCPAPEKFITPAYEKEICRREKSFLGHLESYIRDHAWPPATVRTIPQPRQGTYSERRTDAADTPHVESRARTSAGMRVMRSRPGSRDLQARKARFRRPA